MASSTKRNSFILAVLLWSEETMNGLNENKRNAIVSAEMTLATLVTIIIILASTMATPVAAVLRSTRDAGYTVLDPEVPTLVSGDNIYLAWWTNNTQENGNEEVMFRASSDGGATFSDKINLSNTTDSDSWRVELHGEGDTVVVSWWETNQTSDIPVARISTDAGETFGPMLRLGANGTLSGTEEEGGEGETAVEEEAVGGEEVAE